MEQKKIREYVEKHKDFILKAERELWKMPEAGYKEYKTDAYMKKAFRDLGYNLTEAGDITGFYTVIDTGKSGPTVLALAELDALYCSEHPECDKVTGAVHACGHHAQCAAMLGLAAALKEEGALAGLSGKIKLCVVPAEEGVDIDYRMNLIKEGKITFASGKQEFIARGYFDDVDAAFMVHTNITKKPDEIFGKSAGHNGLIRKRIEIRGKSAHAGAYPYEGINALNAAMLAISAVNNLRETFKDEDRVRFHPIITEGGEAVNAVPEKVVMESYVRAANAQAITEANRRINRAVSAAAAANGCSVHISDIAGSDPLYENPELTDLCIEVFEEIGGKGCYNSDYKKRWSASSTDMGDVAANFPGIHPYCVGAEGTSHGADYRITDPVKACVNSALLQFTLIHRLLENGGKRAKEIKAKFKPVYPSIKDYLELKKSQTAENDTVIQNGDGSITVL